MVSERTSEIYGKPIPFLRLTDTGRVLLKRYTSLSDIRGSDLDGQSPEAIAAVARLSFYQMLTRAGFDIEPERGQFSRDSLAVGKWMETNQPELLFSPFQDLSTELCNEILPPLVTGNYEPRHIEARMIAEPRKPLIVTSKVGIFATKERRSKRERDELADMLANAFAEANGLEEAAEMVAKNYEEASQTDFYPFVAGLFRLLGYDCEHSRAGVHYQRWDAFIEDPNQSIPIEIKSPSEEEYLSPKSIRQALENKIILLSRRQYPTSREATSLVVGFRVPRERSDVNMLLKDIEIAYGLHIGVIDVASLIAMAIAEVVEGRQHDRDALLRLHGIIDVEDIQSTKA